MTLRRSLLLLVALVATGGALMMLAYGREQGLWTVLLLALLGGPVLVVTHLLVEHRGRLGSLSWQLAASVMLTVGLALAGIEVIALTLFVSTHDAFTMALLLAVAGALGGYAVWFLTSRIAKDIHRVREVVTAVRRGDHSRRIDLDTDDELSDLAGEVNRMTAQLRAGEEERAALERARRDMLAAVSHDLRAPVSSVLLLVEAMQAGVLDDAAMRRALAQLAAHARFLDGLIGDLFDLARIEGGDVRWSVEPVHLLELLGETVEGVQARAQAGDVRVAVTAPGPLAPALANPEQIQRVLYNLLDNAIAHSPAGGSVTVETRERLGSVEIDVVDEGAGIPDEDRDRVFEPFFRGSADAGPPRSGAGLGLPIARAIVEAHRGRIWLVEADRGTRVRVSLPIVAEPHSPNRKRAVTDS